MTTLYSLRTDGDLTEHDLSLFDKLFDKSAITESGCYVFTGYIHVSGYGEMWCGGRTRQFVHRLSYFLCNGPIPEGQLVCHKCDNKPCINPEHLFLGSYQDNSSDMVSKGRSLFGANHPRAKLIEDDVLRIRQLIEQNIPSNEIAKQFPVTDVMIARIKYRKAWSHI